MDKYLAPARAYAKELIDLRESIVRAIRATKHGNEPYLPTEMFPWVSEIESQWPSIRADFDRISRAMDILPGIEEISTAQSNLTSDKRWKIFPFCAYGYENKKNQQRCPNTAQAIRSIPGLRAAMFSILQGKKQIPPHYGAYCGVLRLHLGVKVPKPEDQCGLSVANQTAHWKEGSAFIFDDTHLHRAWNHTSEDRAILLIDFARPLEQRLNDINHRIINIMAAELVDKADQHWEAWEAEYGNAFDLACLSLDNCNESRPL